nr:putative ribonuclease H-like domain-containing protein [Tanacetum cinerariifolium]
MKMEYWIMNTDHNLWKIIQNGNSKKSLRRDSKGGIIILPPVSFEEHVVVQRETKARTLLLQSLPKDHMADFHHLDDAREIWLAVKARFGGNEESKKMRKTMLKQAFLEFIVSEEEGLHKGYDRFQNILSQLNQMQAKPNNDDVNIKFLRAFPSSWSQVALTLKTRGCLEYLSFDDLYNKLRSLEIDVKGGSSYGSRSTTVASTQFAFIGAASTNTKKVYSDQPSYSSLISYTPIPSGSIMKDVLHSFIAENEPTQQLAYKDFEQVDQLEMEELDIKWQMAILLLRINKFQKKAGMKINFNNKDSTKFDRRKARCYNCLHLGHFLRECNVKKVDEKARYSAFKILEVKTKEPKAMVSVDFMLNWNEHDAENKTEEAEQVYGLMARFESNFAVPVGNAAGGVNHVVVEFAMMGNSPKVHTFPFGCDSKLSELKQNYDHLEKIYNDSFIQVQAYKNIVKTLEHQKDWYHTTQLALEEKVRISSANLENTTNTLNSKTLYNQAKLEKKEWEVKFVESLARFDKWKESSKNLAKLLYRSMSTRTKLGLRFKEYIGSDEVCDLSTPSVFDPEPDNREVKSLYERFVKAGKMHEVPPPITGTFMPTSYQSDLAETQATFGLKSNTYSIPTSESNDFVSCDNSDKSSALKTYDFASCVSSPKTNDSFSTVDVKLLPKSDLTNDLPSCSFKENVKPPRNVCNKSGIADRIPCKNTFVRPKKCFVCGSKSHLIKDCSVHDTVDNVSSVVSKAAYVPAGSRNSSASISAGRSIPAASRNRSASIHDGRSIPAASRNKPASICAGNHIPAGRINKPAPFPAGSSVPTGWTNPAARPFFRPTNLYFDNVYWHGIYNHMSMNKGRWGSAVKSSADISIVDSGCSRSMTGNKEMLDDFVQVKGGTVTLGGGDDFQLPNESQVVLRIPRRHDLYTFNLSDIQPEQHINCLLAKAFLEESSKWHKRMAHVNFKTINKLARHGLVEGLPLKIFTNEHNCVACNKEKQHKASYKAISAVRTISEPLQLLHMDLFGPTSIRSIDHKYYSLVVIDDFSRFCLAFFMGTKDETFYILKDFIALIENQLNKKVKAIRCDNGTEFRNAKLIALCGEKGIKMDYSNARTRQQNGVTERKNQTLIKAARSMLADSKLPTLNRVSITNPHNKTPYELLSRKVPNIRHLKPFGCQVTILNTSDHLGKFEGKANDGFLVGYAAHSKACRVCTHDTNILAGTQVDDSYSECDEQVILVPSFPSNSFLGPTVHDVSAPMENNLDYAEELARLQRQEYEAHSTAAKPGFEFSVDAAALLPQAEIKIRRNLVPAAGDLAGSIVSAGGVPTGSVTASGVPAGSVPASSVPTGGVLTGSIVSTGGVPAGSVPVSGVLAGSIVSAGFGDPAVSAFVLAVFTNAPAATSPFPRGHSLGSCEHTTRFPSPSDLGNHQPSAGIFSSSSYDDDFYADVTNLASNVAVDPVATKKVNTIHPPSQIIRALQKIAIGTKWILKNKRDARGIVVRNKARLVAQGHRQEEGIDYDEVFAPVARIEVIRLFLAFVSYMGFMVYQMDIKSTFLYGEIEEAVYVTQPKGLEDPHNPKHMYRVVKALYGLHQAPRAWYARLSTFLLKHHYRRGTIDKTMFLKKDSRHIILVQVYVDDIIFGSTNKAWCDEFEVLMKGEFEMSAMGELTFFLGLQVIQLPDGIFISQYKYVKDMLKKFDIESVRTATTPYEVPKHKSKDDPDDAVNVHLFRSMIGSLMYLTASRPDIMFAVSACFRHQLKAYSDSDYVGFHGDRKSTTSGCQFLGIRLISWQCKKQTVIATSSTEAEYVAAASCCGQVLRFGGGISLRGGDAYHDMAGHTKHFTTLRKLLYMVEKTDLQKLLGAVNELYQKEEPDTFALLLWRIHSWRLYPRAQVHVLETVDGRVIHMFVDVSYPLTVATLERMLKHGLEVPKLLVGGDLTMAEQLVSRVGFSTTLQMVFSSPWLTAKKELTQHEGTALWLVQGGTALGKDKSNPLTVGSLLKTTWSSIHHLLTDEVLSSPEQTAIGKDVSNSLMAVMVCQKPLGYFSSPMIHVPRAELVFNPPGYVVPAGRVRIHSCCCVSAGKHSFYCQ